MNDYSELRALLLGREIDAITSMQVELQRLTKELQDPKEIIARLAPHIDAIIERNIGLGRETLVSVLSPIIADVLSKQIEQSQDAIAKTLAPVISKAISVQIKTQRDEVVDALYPVIGTTVARFVSQTFKDLLQNINSQLNDAFSIQNLRRKLRAKLKGIPESELLLAESASWQVESIFLIHKKSGLLMAQKERPGSALSEPEMVASMLTAIRSLVNEWISNNGCDSEVDQIEYGNSTIYLEVAGSCYLATVVTGAVSSRLTQSIGTALSHILEQQDDKIRQFNGDRSLIDTVQIDQELQSVLTLEPSVREEVRVNRTPLLILSAVLLSGMIYAGYLGMERYRHEKEAAELNSGFRQDPNLALYPINASVDAEKVVLSGAVESLEQFERAESKARSKALGKTVENHLLIVKRSESSSRTKTEQFEKALKALRRTEPYKVRFYFDVGSAHVKAQQRYKVEIIRLARAIHPEYAVRVEGYSDRSGTTEIRLKTASLRAEAVKALLKSEDVNVTQCDTTYFSSIPTDLNRSNFLPEQARVVIVKLMPESKEETP